MLADPVRDESYVASDNPGLLGRPITPYVSEMIFLFWLLTQPPAEHVFKRRSLSSTIVELGEAGMLSIEMFV